MDKLQSILRRIDGRGYKAYKDIQGTWQFPNHTLHIDHVQGDPFAAPSRVRVVVPANVTGFAGLLYETASRATGLTSYLAYCFGRETRHASNNRGSGKSGQIQIESPGQEVLKQTAVMIDSKGNVEARFTVGLPARGRSVLGMQAERLLFDDVPAIVANSLVAKAHKAGTLAQHAAVNEDADALRMLLPKMGLVAFVADGAILPRRSGVDDRPLESGQGTDVIPFSSPESLRVTVQLPHAGEVTGLGIPAGVTLIVGGGYHGKSTLLRAIERGVYNHCPGDGREQVVSVLGLVKIRAEDGRAVTGVNISPFINGLPMQQSTTAFHTTNASGSTSQAASIMEAVEVGATGLLIDEDTAATNFMIRDGRMQALVAKAHEPITPFIDRVRQLYEEHNISSILVIGGSGDYLDVADNVIAMQSFRPLDVTDEARTISTAHPTQRANEAAGPININSQRIPVPNSLDARQGKRDVSIKTRGVHAIQFGREDIDLAAIEQLVAWSQTRAIGEALWYARQKYLDGQRSLAEALALTVCDVEAQGFDILDRRKMGDFAEFRVYELAAALNRLRSLRVK
ncbi:MAG: ABC-ATPase domain-containing protein [Chloroflexota bacterium]